MIPAFCYSVSCSVILLLFCFLLDRLLDRLKSNKRQNKRKQRILALVTTPDALYTLSHSSKPEDYILRLLDNVILP